MTIYQQINGDKIEEKMVFDLLRGKAILKRPPE